MESKIKTLDILKGEEKINKIIEIEKELIVNKKVIIGKEIYKINSGIKEEEGKYLCEMIKKYNLNNCIEIGMAFGISSFYILTNPNTNLISIDPYQSTQWDNMGKKLLLQCKFNKRHKLFEEKSYIMLP
jgi:RIO-like serine/threonine protein kinase